MENLLKLDGNLHAELSADIQKELNLDLNRAKTVPKKEKNKDGDLVKEVDREKVRKIFFFFFASYILSIKTIFSSQFS